MSNISKLLKEYDNISKIKKIEKYLEIFPADVIDVIIYYIKKNDSQSDYILNKSIDIFFNNKNYILYNYEKFLSDVFIYKKYDLLNKFDMSYINKNFNYRYLFSVFGIDNFLNLRFENDILNDKYNILFKNFQNKKFNFYEKRHILKITDEEKLTYYLNKINFKENNYSFLNDFILSDINNKIKIKYLEKINYNVLSHFLPRVLLDNLNNEINKEKYKQNYELLNYFLPKMNLELNDLYILKKVLHCEKEDVVDIFIKNIKDDKCLSILDDYAVINNLDISNFKFKIEDKLLKDKLEVELIYEVDTKVNSAKRKM